MAIGSEFNAKTIDELQELGKLTGSEMAIVSYNGTETKKVSIDTIIGFAASMINNISPATAMALTGSRGGDCITVIPEGEEIPISQRTPGCFYLEQTKQTSIRTKVNVPTSVVVGKSLALKRV
jgi:hypothetical protein